MKPRARSRLIRADQIPKVFDSQTIENSIRLAKLPSNIDCNRFSVNVHDAIRGFLLKKNELNWTEVRSAIARLYSLASKAERGGQEAVGRLANAIRDVPPELRRWLALVNHGGASLPTASDILIGDPAPDVLGRIRRMLSHGGRVQTVRSGGRTKRVFKPYLKAPTGPRGRPRQEAERELIQWLAIAYTEAGEALPPRSSHFDESIRGPFSRMVHHCFELIGAPTGNLTNLLNEYCSMIGRD